MCNSADFTAYCGNHRETCFQVLRRECPPSHPSNPSQCYVCASKYANICPGFEINRYCGPIGPPSEKGKCCSQYQWRHSGCGGCAGSEGPWCAQNRTVCEGTGHPSSGCNGHFCPAGAPPPPPMPPPPPLPPAPSPTKCHDNEFCAPKDHACMAPTNKRCGACSAGETCESTTGLCTTRGAICDPGHECGTFGYCNPGNPRDRNSRRCFFPTGAGGTCRGDTDCPRRSICTHATGDDRAAPLGSPKICVQVGTSCYPGEA